MKLLIDTERKTISIKGDMNVGEFIDEVTDLLVVR